MTRTGARARDGRRRPAVRPRDERDQQESAFTSILAELVRRVPGARGAVLVDVEGESVDYAGRLEPFDLRVAGAHFRVVLDDAASRPSLAGVELLAVRASRASYRVHRLPEGYAVVLVLTRAAGFGASGWGRPFAACARALAAEAGWRWDGMKPPPAWFAIDVLTGSRGRPAAIRTASGPREIEVLGAVVSARERAWRVRFDSGVEATLVREAGGSWYSDEPFDAAAVGRSTAEKLARNGGGDRKREGAGRKSLTGRTR